MIHFIVNPVSGNGKTKRYIPLIEKLLKEKSIEYQFLMTEYKGHAVKIAYSLRREPKSHLVIAMGGDGTLNEVVNGLYPSDVRLGYIPAGSGNDFAREMGIPSDPVQALLKIIEGPPKPIDIGKINERYFVNAAGIGFDGKVIQIANRSPFKHKFGKFIYIIAVIQALYGYQPTQLEMVVNGKKYSFKGVWLIAVSNGRYFGGGMKISPNAKNNDGLLDVCVINEMTPLQLIRYFPTIFSGKHIDLPYVKMFRGSKIDIFSESVLPIQIDGEISNQDEEKYTLSFDVMTNKQVIL
ncbi:diacylglycerol kinase family protein [Tepidibacillus marianensis]|uniref:diacylglycerol/lipid kinase family protein n=1 Tax=Tepidibacillus marianensis TaxID=3131995 RepID=UPI0030CD7D3E